MKKLVVLAAFAGAPVFADGNLSDGFYIGLGAGMVSQSTSLDQEPGKLIWGGSNRNRQVTPGPGYRVAVGSMYFSDRLKLGSSRATRFAGAMEIGYGKLLCNNFYFGAVASADLTGNKSANKGADGVFDSIRITNDGFVPFVGARLAYCLPEIGGMIGLRFGGAYVGSKAHLKERNSGAEYSVKLRNFTPAVGLEFEKFLSSTFSVKLQADYRFRSSRILTDGAGFHRGGSAVAEYAPVKLKTDGFAVRVMGVFHLFGAE